MLDRCTLGWDLAFFVVGILPCDMMSGRLAVCQRKDNNAFGEKTQKASLVKVVESSPVIMQVEPVDF